MRAVKWSRINDCHGFANRYTPFPGLTMLRVREILTELSAAAGRRFWPDSVSILERNRFDLSAAGPNTLTDIYLLRLAVAFDGRLVTFDRTIRCSG